MSISCKSVGPALSPDRLERGAWPLVVSTAGPTTPGPNSGRGFTIGLGHGHGAVRPRSIRRTRGCPVRFRGCAQGSDCAHSKGQLSSPLAPRVIDELRASGAYCAMPMLRGPDHAPEWNTAERQRPTVRLCGRECAEHGTTPAKRSPRLSCVGCFSAPRSILHGRPIRVTIPSWRICRTCRRGIVPKSKVREGRRPSAVGRHRHDAGRHRCSPCRRRRGTTLTSIRH